MPCVFVSKSIDLIGLINFIGLLDSIKNFHEKPNFNKNLNNKISKYIFSFSFLVTFFRDSLLIAALSVVVTIFVRRLHTKTRSPAHWITDLIKKMESVYILEIVLLGEKFSKEEDSVEMIENSKNHYSAWNQVATLVDRIFFYLCCFTYSVLLFFYLP